MTTIIQNSLFKVSFNGKSTYFIIDSTDYCIGRFDTEKKALNYFNKVSYSAGL